jgi:uncharacterized protein YlxW (UPF0749 family)
MENKDIKAENVRLMKEIKQLKKQEKSLNRKLNTANRKKAALQRELKKKDAPKIELSNEQLKSLSSLLGDIDILN